MSGEKLPISDEVRVAETGRRELDSRRAHGVEVVIWWVKKSNLCIVSLSQAGKERPLEFAVEPDKVLDALQHPYPYADRAGMSFDDIPDAETTE